MREKVRSNVVADIYLPYPPSVNSLFANRRGGRGKGRYPTAEYKAWREEAGWALTQQHPQSVQGRYAVRVSIRRPPDNRRRDLDNLYKAVSDLLVAHKVVEGDHLAEEITLKWVDMGHEGVRVMVYKSIDPEKKQIGFAPKGEPEWWEEARKLKAQGYRSWGIGYLLGKSESTVRRALDPNARAKQNLKDRENYKLKKERENETSSAHRKRIANDCSRRYRAKKRGAAMDDSRQDIGNAGASPA